MTTLDRNGNYLRDLADYAFLNSKKIVDDFSISVKEPSEDRLKHSEKDLIRHSSKFRVQKIRNDFPYFLNPTNPIWFDNAASTQKPETVIFAESEFYKHHYSNIHRGAHRKSCLATEMYESARKTVSQFLGAKDPREIVFLRGATEGLNFLAYSLGETFFQKKNNQHILVMEYEHHANLVPWQILAQRYSASLHAIPFDENGDVNLHTYGEMLERYRPAVVSLGHVSNVLGSISPIQEMTAMAHSVGSIVVIDGAQGLPHIFTNVQDIDCDFYVFSAHKIFGPTGIGALYGRAHLLEQLCPWQFGGNMIQDVSFERTTFAPVPARFEAGTPAIVQAIGLEAALNYIQCLDYKWISEYETQLIHYLLDGLRNLRGIKIIGNPKHRASLVSFVLTQKSQTSFGKFLDTKNIALRIGHHCALPALKHFGLTSVVRPSLAFYNTFEEIDKFLEACQIYQH